MIKITLEFLSIEAAQGFLENNAQYCGPYNMASEGEEVPQDDPPESSKEETPPEADKKSRRRGRPAGSKSGKKDEKTAGRAGRRRANGDLKTPESSEGKTPDADISDADASKAASEAARELGVDIVLGELHKYEVDKVSELDQPQRKEFVETLRELLNEKTPGAKAW